MTEVSRTYLFSFLVVSKHNTHGNLVGRLMDDMVWCGQPVHNYFTLAGIGIRGINLDAVTPSLLITSYSLLLISRFQRLQSLILLL